MPVHHQILKNTLKNTRIFNYSPWRVVVVRKQCLRIQQRERWRERGRVMQIETRTRWRWKDRGWARKGAFVS